MSLAAKFRNPAPAAAPAAGAPAPAARPAPGRRAGTYAGIKAAEGRPPFPHAPNTLRIKIIKTELTRNEYFSVAGEVLEALDVEKQPVGSKVTLLVGSLAAGKARDRNGPHMKAMIMAALGYTTRQLREYDAFDPDGAFIDACLGFDGCVMPDGAAIEPNPLVDAIVDVDVGRGANTKEGTDYFREYSFSVAEGAAPAAG